MYKGKNCVERPTKNKPGWTKNELLDECKKLGLECKTTMTKAQICEVLNKVNKEIPKKDDVSMNPCKFPRDIKYKILMDLSYQEVNKLCLVDKQCKKICDDEEFWRRRYFARYNNRDKPNDISWKKWYKINFNSGDLHVITSDTFTPVAMTANNVVKCYSIGKVVFFIDIYQDLYVIGNPAIIPYGYSIKYEIENKNHIVPFKLRSGIIDIFFGQFSLYLQKNGVVTYYAGVLSNDKFKKIYSNSLFTDGCLLLSIDDTLYHVAVKNYRKTVIKLDTDVKYANMLNNKYILYVKNDNSLWKASIDYGYNETLDTPGDISSVKSKIKTSKVFNKNVKKVTCTNDYILITDINNILWIYELKRLFYEGEEYNITNTTARSWSLSGFDQSQYKKHDFISIFPGNIVSFIDNDSEFILAKKINR